MRQRSTILPARTAHQYLLIKAMKALGGFGGAGGAGGIGCGGISIAA